MVILRDYLVLRSACWLVLALGTLVTTTTAVSRVLNPHSDPYTKDRETFDSGYNTAQDLALLASCCGFLFTATRRLHVIRVTPAAAVAMDSAAYAPPQLPSPSPPSAASSLCKSRKPAARPRQLSLLDRLNHF